MKPKKQQAALSRLASMKHSCRVFTDLHTLPSARGSPDAQGT